MNKIKRWDVQFPYSEYPKWHRMCDTKDVEKLEASYAELALAAKDIITRWDSPHWKRDENTTALFNRLRKAVKKYKKVNL